VEGESGYITNRLQRGGQKISGVVKNSVLFLGNIKCNNTEKGRENKYYTKSLRDKATVCKGLPGWGSKGGHKEDRGREKICAK